MATKKSKSSNKSNKDKSTKPKTANQPTENVELKAVDTISEETEKVEKTKSVSSSKKSCLRGFFARKYTEKEGILTVFKNHKFYGALLGETIGTMLLSLLLLSLSLMGIANVATYAFALIAILIAVYAFSGACLNPIITIGMIASRRMSVIRGIMYIVAEILGAWFGWLIINGFHLAGGESAYDIPAISEITEGGFWPIAMIELLGAAIIAFCFARALAYKRSVFTFAAIVAGGVCLAIIIGYVSSAAFLSANNSFIMNPAVALMMKIFPEAGGNFGEILGGICQALSAYALLPMIGGIIGFYLSDFTARISEAE